MIDRTFSAEAKSILHLMPKKLISTKVFLWTYPISVFLSLFIAPDNSGSQGLTLTWLLIGFASHSAMYPFVLYAKSKERFSEQLFLLIAMGVTRGSVLALLPPFFDLTDSLSPFVRITNSTLAVFYWFSAGSVIVEYGSNFRRQIKDLVKEILEKKIVDMPVAAKANSRELITIIGHLQEKIVSTVGATPTKDEIKEASKDIDRIISEYIRPLSQSRWKDGEITWIRAGFFSVLRRTLIANRIPVVGVIALTMPFALAAQSSRIGFVSSISVLFIWISATLILSRWVYRTNPNSGYLKQNLTFIGALILFVYPLTFALQLLTPIKQEGSFSTVVIGYLLSMTTQLGLFIISTLLVSIHDDQEFAFEFLRDLIKRGELEEFLAKTRQGNSDENFAQYVHAEVQSQLLACKLLLLKAAESEFELFPPEVTMQIIERMESIKQPYQKPSTRIPAERVEVLKNSWKGLAEITHALPAELSKININSDVIAQLIEESVVNSIRHGGADKIHISAKQLSGGIEVVVRDNGQMNPEGNQSPGLGSILFNTFTKDWTLQREENATVVTFFVEDLEKGAFS